MSRAVDPSEVKLPSSLTLQPLLPRQGATTQDRRSCRTQCCLQPSHLQRVTHGPSRQKLRRRYTLGCRALQAAHTRSLLTSECDQFSLSASLPLSIELLLAHTKRGCAPGKKPRRRNAPAQALQRAKERPGNAELAAHGDVLSPGRPAHGLGLFLWLLLSITTS